MSTHDIAVPGATLHCEVRGSGPSLLLITGGNGDSGIYTPIADLLSDKYRVITYDPRGNSRSPLSTDPYPIPVEDLADDARAVLTALADAPVAVFGSSSGALATLDLVTRYPELVHTAVPHEPPAFELLPDAVALRAEFQHVYEVFRDEGLMAGWQAFEAVTGLDDDDDHEIDLAALPPEAQASMRRTMANMPFFLEWEMRSFVSYRPDLDRLAKVPTRIVPAGGAASHEQLPYQPNLLIATHLGTTVTDFPGDHTGYAEHPTEFATQLAKLLG